MSSLLWTLAGFVAVFVTGFLALAALGTTAWAREHSMEPRMVAEREAAREAKACLELALSTLREPITAVAAEAAEDAEFVRRQNYFNVEHYCAGCDSVTWGMDWTADGAWRCAGCRLGKRVSSETLFADWAQTEPRGARQHGLSCHCAVCDPPLVPSSQTDWGSSTKRGLS